MEMWEEEKAGCPRGLGLRGGEKSSKKTTKMCDAFDFVKRRSLITWLRAALVEG